MEFPGYGIYTYDNPSEKTVLDDAYYIMQFVTRVLQVKRQNILIMGRSIGTGVATEMTAIIKPSVLILMSAFVSIKKVVRDQLGYGLSLLIKERFNNA